jgi:hypothetical protein
LIVRNNVFSRFSQSLPTGIGAALNFGGASGSLAGDGSIVENNTFWNNGGAHYGLLDTNGSTLTVRNNIFSAITGAGVAAVGCHPKPGTLGRGASSGTVYDSVMFGNTNNVEAGCAGAGWTMSTYYTDSPYFVNPSATPPDLHVESSTGSRRNNTSTWVIDAHCSVAIDKAPATFAFDREPSPNGGRRNLGAYGNTPEASKSCIPVR